MGFFDDKPKKKDGLFDSKYEPDAWRKNIPYNDTTIPTFGIEDN